MYNTFHRSILISVENSPYSHNNRQVPRVTSILSDMLHEDYLMVWSNNIGLGRKKYKEVLQNSADIGTEVHNRIDEFLKTGKVPLPYSKNFMVNSAFKAFINWWNEINNGNKVNIIFNERTLICKLFGGTLDLLIEINGKKYLIDFKTSNNSSYKHHLQLAAYRYMLKEELDIEVDGGCCILMLSKKHIGLFTEDMMDFSNLGNINYIDSCLNTFLSLTDAYYNRITIEKLYKER